jgi:hypothetical protein
LKTYKITIIVIIIISLFALACTPNESMNNSINPNVSSDLSILMNSMVRELDSQRVHIKHAKPQAIPPILEHLKIAEPTESHQKKADYDSMADNLIELCGELYNSKNTDKTKEYNAVIQSCADCHHTSCPGPLKIINKMFIESSM